MTLRFPASRSISPILSAVISVQVNRWPPLTLLSLQLSETEERVSQSLLRDSCVMGGILFLKQSTNI